jgi:hypothetical protein
VDGDVVTFRAGFGAERMEYDVIYTDPNFGEEIVISTRYKKEAVAVQKELTERGNIAESEIVPRRVLEPLSHALRNVGTILTNIVDSLGVRRSDVTVWLSGPSEQNFRKQIATIKPYKGSRKDAWRPTYEAEIKDYIMRKWNGQITYGQEADDAMGIEQMRHDFGASCIATNDKDLDMIPGLHYNFVTDERYVVDEETALWLFWQQLLKGDPTDDIVGIPGVGEAKAYAALEDCWDDPQQCADVAWSLYVQSYGWAAYPALLENARLLWIRRKEEELWTPDLLIT